MASFEKLDAHKKIVEYSSFLQPLLPRIRKKSRSLGSQMVRSCESAELTLDEASKEQTPAMIVNYLRMSHGSLTEQLGSLKIAERIGAITKREHIQGALVLRAALFFVHRLIIYWEKQK